ncbi:MAG: hypothetical protein LLF76_02320 [Planctomycetaceae bacterium]|nr:hypothetical protein [Planctomycetaceae bacterium]
MGIEPGSNEQADQIRTVRRIIMQRLNQAFPARMLVGTLFKHAIYIEPSYEKKNFVKDLFYLEKKGYLEFPDNIFNRGAELMDKLIVLTAEGKEIAEQTMVDEAMKL